MMRQSPPVLVFLALALTACGPECTLWEQYCDGNVKVQCVEGDAGPHWNRIDCAESGDVCRECSLERAICADPDLTGDPCQ